ncbi:MAG: cytidine deaminase [Pseudobdellovibrionaceae bacterium]|jgi:cytidine deaminase
MKTSLNVKKAYGLALSVRKRAHAPYSKYLVGAAVGVRKSGSKQTDLFFGCNVENASFGATVCAERVAVWSAVAAGFSQVEFVVIVTQDKKPAPPCAQCLQVLAEFCKPSTAIYLANLQGIKEQLSFADLLPRPFVFTPV